MNGNNQERTQRTKQRTNETTKIKQKSWIQTIGNIFVHLYNIIIQSAQLRENGGRKLWGAWTKPRRASSSLHTPPT